MILFEFSSFSLLLQEISLKYVLYRHDHPKSDRDVLPCKHGRIFAAVAGMVAATTATAVGRAATVVAAVVVPNESASINSSTMAVGEEATADEGLLLVAVVLPRPPS